MLVLPFQPSIPYYRFACPIEQSVYLFDVGWNTRADAWYFDVREVDETPIRLGIKIVLGTYLGRTTNHPLFRDGVIVAEDMSGQRLDAKLDDLGKRVIVRRLTGNEVLALNPAFNGGLV